MKHNLMDAASSAALIARAQGLQPEHKAQWGTMSVTGMMNHCNKIHHAVATGAAPHEKPGMKQRIMKTIALSLMRQLPKGIRTPAKATLPDEDAALNFEAEKAQLIDSLKALANRRDPLHQRHPMFGKLSNREWGRFLWMHTDHHLRQFGV